MNAIALNDLSLSQDLDRQALCAIKGSGSFDYLIGSYSTYSAWGNRIYGGGSIVNPKIYHNGKYTEQRIEQWTRSRTETSHETWNRYYF